MRLNEISGLLAAAALATIMMPAAITHAETYVVWTTGTTSTLSTPGTVSGTLFGTVNVTYTGDVAWFNPTDGPLNYAPAADFTAGGTINPPPNTGLIGLSQGYSGTYGSTSLLSPNLDTVTFSKPVLNPIIDIVSLGWGTTQPVDFTFSATPTILSQGTDNWGGGPSDLLLIGGNTVEGTEGTGAVQFDGTYSSISWTATGGEYWNGITAGAQTPEPSSLLLLGTGLAAFAGMLRRKLRA